MFEDCVSFTVSPVPVPPVPPVPPLLLLLLPHAASTSTLVAASVANLRYLRCCMWCGSPLDGVVSAPRSPGGQPRNDGPEVVDALSHVADRTLAGRWLVTGDGGVLLEDVPLVVPRDLEGGDDLADRHFPLAERAEETSLHGVHEAQLAGANLRREVEPDVLEVDVSDAT